MVILYGCYLLIYVDSRILDLFNITISKISLLALIWLLLILEFLIYCFYSLFAYLVIVFINTSPYLATVILESYIYCF
jgi:hypothetical protein